MQVQTRKPGEAIDIEYDGVLIRVYILDVDQRTVRLGLQAPPAVKLGLGRPARPPRKKRS